MATNEIFNTGNQIDVTLASVTSGDPVVAGQIPGLALNSTDANGKVTMKTDGVATFSVKGIDGGGSSAVAVGDILYYVNADTPKISKKNTGVRFGYALEAVSSGSTATIRVKIGY
jgi:predicted RecA/RadA family phage recombinase